MRASQRRACGSVPELSCRRDRNRDSVVLSRHTDHGMRPPAPTLMQHALALARSLVRSFVCSFVRLFIRSFAHSLVLPRPPIVEVHQECIHVCVLRESNNSSCLENNSNCLRENLLFALLQQRHARVSFHYLPNARNK